MLDYIKELDESLLLYLNSFHSQYRDAVLFMFTRKEIWVFLYAAMIALVVRKYGKKSAIILGILVLAVVFSDQTSTLIKDMVERLRPTHTPEIQALVHIVEKKGGLYGFFSSHASNAIAAAYITSMLFRNKIYTCTVFAWALLICYTRIYLGVHYPLDVLAGIAWGFLTGFLFFRLIAFTEKKIGIAAQPPLAESAINRNEALFFLLVFGLMILTILLVVARLQHYNLLAQ